MPEVRYHFEALSSLRRRLLRAAVAALVAMAALLVTAEPSSGHSSVVGYNNTWTENGCSWKGSNAHYYNATAIGISEKVNQYCHSVRVRIRWDDGQTIWWTSWAYAGSSSDVSVSRSGHLWCSQHGGQGLVHEWVTRQISLPHGCS
jgi:hypothetical protein